MKKFVFYVSQHLKWVASSDDVCRCENNNTTSLARGSGTLNYTEQNISYLNILILSPEICLAETSYLLLISFFLEREQIVLKLSRYLSIIEVLYY